MTYVAKVVDHVVARCHGISIPDPMDYVIISEWEKRGIPLNTVLETITSSCDGLANSEINKIKSADYFQEALEKNFVKWLQSQDY